MNKIGIYKILNTKNDKMYIGSTFVSFSNRWNMHKYLLRKDIHPNKYLQSAWNKYGEENFQFEIIEECIAEKLIEREQYWIDFTKCYKRDIGYNLRKKAENNFGIKLNFSEEGYRNKKEKNKGELSYSSKLTWESVNLIRKLYKEFDITMRELSDMFNCSSGHMERIIQNKKWKDENYEYVVDRSQNAFKAKLSWKKVEEIRKEYFDDRRGLREISLKYNVHLETIRRIINNKCWKIGVE